MKKIALAAAALAVAAAPLVVVAPATANTACMTHAEYRHIHKGQTVRKVQHIVGSKGELLTDGSRLWDVCGPSEDQGIVGFKHKHVASKSIGPCTLCPSRD